MKKHYFLILILFATITPTYTQGKLKDEAALQTVKQHLLADNIDALSDYLKSDKPKRFQSKNTKTTLSILTLAIQLGSPKAVKKILKAGYEFDKSKKENNIDYDWYHIIERGDAEITQTALANRYNPNQRLSLRSEDGQTGKITYPIILAIQKKDMMSIFLLLKNGASPNAVESSYFGRPSNKNRNYRFNNSTAYDLVQDWKEAKDLLRSYEAKKIGEMKQFGIPLEVKEGPVRVRKYPKTEESPTLGFLKKGSIVYALKTGKKETIDGKKGVWLYLVDRNGMTGWCFDYYLKFINKY